MSKMIVKLNLQGVRDLINSDEMAQITQEYASNIANSCGSGYEVEHKRLPKKRISIVETKTHSAMRDNSKNNTLLKAFQRKG